MPGGTVKSLDELHQHRNCEQVAGAMHCCFVKRHSVQAQA